MAQAMGATARMGASTPTCSLDFLYLGSRGSMQVPSVASQVFLPGCGGHMCPGWDMHALPTAGRELSPAKYGQRMDAPVAGALESQSGNTA